MEGPGIGHSVHFCRFSAAEEALVQSPRFRGEQAAPELLSCSAGAVNGLRRGHTAAPMQSSFLAASREPVPGQQTWLNGV